MARNRLCSCFIPFLYLRHSLLSLSYLLAIQSPFSALLSSFCFTLYNTPTFFPFRTFIFFLPYFIHISVIWPFYCYSSSRNLQTEDPPISYERCVGFCPSAMGNNPAARSHILKISMHYTYYTAIIHTAHTHGHRA